MLYSPIDIMNFVYLHVHVLHVYTHVYIVSMGSLTCIDSVGTLCLKHTSHTFNKPVEDTVKYTAGLVGLQQASLRGDES